MQKQFNAYGNGIFGRNRKSKFFSLALVCAGAEKEPDHNYLAGLAIQAAKDAKIQKGTRLFVSWHNVEARPDGIDIHEMRSHDLFSVQAQ